MGISKIVEKIFHGYNGRDKKVVDKKVKEIKQVFFENFNDVLRGPYALSNEQMSKVKKEGGNATPSTG